jgi:hypothetical protein
MKRFRELKLSAALVIGLGLVPAVCTASVQGSFQRTYDVNGPVNLEVFSHSGDITVRSGPSSTVSVTGRIHVGNNWLHVDHKRPEVSELEKNPPIHQSGNGVRIEYVEVRDISIDYEITVPTNTTVHTRSSSGDQTISGVRGNLTLESSSGNMRLEDIDGDIHLRASSGDVEARDTAGNFDAEAGSGNIRLSAKSAGDVHVHTGSGNIELRNIDGSLNLQAGSGDVIVDGSQRAPWEVKTGSGNVQVRLQSNAAFDLEASTGSGNLVVDQPLTTTVSGDVRAMHHSIHGKVGGGGPLLAVHTGSGDVHIQ